jgi:hypothetical protein
MRYDIINIHPILPISCNSQCINHKNYFQDVGAGGGGGGGGCDYYMGKCPFVSASPTFEMLPRPLSNAL